ncbi:hypothetical protein IEQ44_12000 [Nocardioides sp. Y6]|uniref:Esterase-like activity of phytase family protein n=1 Tax=Nocardioides malaquae TaxID=2773426 RepID=A0ABR9RUZ9_9ACTN|nr:hypothetical protein [Nocardioides malaquae]MBE7325377.1 hypothetical protein [Nocardioides malaquae]
MATVKRSVRWSEAAPTLVALTVVSAAASTVHPGLTAGAAAPEPADSEVAFRVADPEIVESSGLAWADVDGRRWIVTVNDSGDTGRVFTLDPESGETVGVTTFEPDPSDVEALAPAGDGHVWVADIGDNARMRRSLVLTRVPVGPGDRVAGEEGEEGEVERREVRYPDRRRDAEALLAHPGTGELFVVSKGLLGGQVWQVPDAGSGARGSGRVDPLRQVGLAPALVTDGAFLPSGDHVLLRGYTHGFVLTYPEWEVVDTFELPPQPQGEGLTVLPEGEVLISTEGSNRDVLRVALPEVVRHERDPVRAWWQGVWSRWVARL